MQRDGRIDRQQCGVDRGHRGSVIRHAAASPIGALVVAMIAAALRARLMARPGGAHAPVTSRALTARRAVGVATITRGANRKRGAAGAAHLLAQRNVVHGVASAAATSPGRTRDSVAQQTRQPRAPMESPRWSRGSGVPVRTLTSALPPQRTRPVRSRHDGPWTLPVLRARSRAHRTLQNRADAVSHKRPQAIIPVLDQKTGSERPGRGKSRFLRFYVASDTLAQG